MTGDLEVREDTKLSQEEKELTLVTSKADDVFHLHSEISAVNRWLLRNDEFDETDRRVVDGNLVALSGTLPVGATTLKAKSRKSNYISQMLSQAGLNETEGNE